MRILLRLIAVLSAVTTLVTARQVIGFVRLGELGTLVASGPLGWATVLGWTATLVVGPVTAVQLWRLRMSGRLAGIALFGTGAAYYALGAFALRGADAPLTPILAAALYFCAPLCVLLTRRAKEAIGQAALRAIA